VRPENSHSLSKINTDFDANWLERCGKSPPPRKRCDRCYFLERDATYVVEATLAETSELFVANALWKKALLEQRRQTTNRLATYPATFLACAWTFAHRFFAAFAIFALPAADSTRFFTSAISQFVESPKASRIGLTVNARRHRPRCRLREYWFLGEQLRRRELM
jgi:hypothetical protein